MTETAATYRETWYTAEGHPMSLGDEVWTRSLDWSAVRGSQVFETYGVYSGYEGSARPLILRHARRDYRCSDCGDKIRAEDLHGSTYYDHYCLNCVTPQQPPCQFREKA